MRGKLESPVGNVGWQGCPHPLTVRRRGSTRTNVHPGESREGKAGVRTSMEIDAMKSEPKSPVT